MAILQLALRGLQFLWALLILALSADMVNKYGDGTPSIINYCVFVGVFSMLTLLYLLPAAIKDSFFIPIAAMAMDGLNVLFYFCGAVALAAMLGVHSCSNGDYTGENGVISGADNEEGVCREAQATDAFLWFGFAAFAVTAVLSILGGRK